MGKYDDVPINLVPVARLDISGMSTNTLQQWKDILNVSGLPVFYNSQLFKQEELLYEKYMRIQKKLDDPIFVFDPGQKESLQKKQVSLQTIYTEVIAELTYRKSGVIIRD